MSQRRCPECDRTYGYELPECTWCRVPLEVVHAETRHVVAVTEVNVPSIGHEDVPYWVALSRDGEDLLHIEKSDKAVSPGDVLSSVPDPVRQGTVGVIGTGVMGRGLVELLLGLGWRVRWLSRSVENAGTARDRVFDRLLRSMDQAEIDAAASRLEISIDESSLADCDLVVEAVVEDLETKKRVLRHIEPSIRRDAVLATNTSGLPLQELADVLEHPERFGALHFFNPVTRMRLVETSVVPSTSAETSAALDEFAESLGKQPVRVKARPAFIVNRVLMPLINEAVRSLAEEAASAEHIDEAIRLGLNHPMGPLALADLIGLDIVVDIMDNLVEQTGDRSYAPEPFMQRLVDVGHLGRKSGQGFYDYR